MVCCDWLFGKRAMSDVGEKHARKSNKQWGCFLFVFVVACVAGFVCLWSCVTLTFSTS